MNKLLIVSIVIILFSIFLFIYYHQTQKKNINENFFTEGIIDKMTKQVAKQQLAKLGKQPNIINGLRARIKYTKNGLSNMITNFLDPNDSSFNVGQFLLFLMYQYYLLVSLNYL